MAVFKRIISLITSLIMTIAGYPMSFLPSQTDTDFFVAAGSSSDDFLTVNGNETALDYSADAGKISFDFSDTDCGYFNYFGISYSSDAYLKGEITYSKGKTVSSEEFFLEPCENGVFYSFIDGVFDKKKMNGLCSVSFAPLDKAEAEVEIFGISTFNREIPEREIFIENGKIRIGIDLLWGGALSYFEDLDSNVEAVKVDGITKVDSNASERYGKRAVNKSVNLINANDTGRLVQQSYYGSDGSSGDGYTPGIFMDNRWNYNPVQGGNQYNESSKIVDLKVTENEIYVKCRPLDWSLPEENITPSYMEATYVLDGARLDASCRFVDFSGYTPTYTSQEIPAFYCIEPFNRFVYCPDEDIEIVPDLIFWPDAGYPKFNSTENWAGFIGEFDDSFGIGVYVEGENSFLAGVYNRETTDEKDPAHDDPTSYIAVIKFITFESFTPFSYNFSLTSGTAEEIRQTFAER
ncbi:MAG: hypothetical protein J6R20_02550 [Clostridia bacterium]|nr:hypothetical protein [Clostridia bacterium]